MEDTQKYFAGLTETELEEYEPIEAELNATTRDGFSEATAFAFVKTFAALRKIVPAATVAGVFEAALLVGLDELPRRLNAEAEAEAEPAQKIVPKRKPKRPGVRLVT